MKLVLASANPDKVAEIAAILGSSVELSARPAELRDTVEDGDSLEANARLKAVAVAEFTSEAAVADDTGLEVDALDGAPGVWSARYAGADATYEANVGKLLDELVRVGADRDEHRTARFRTVALVRYPDGREVIAEGMVEGTIARAPRGREGFGYDPVFVPSAGNGRTFGEMSPDEKHALSHRGRAFRSLAVALGS